MQSHPRLTEFLQLHLEEMELSVNNLDEILKLVKQIGYSDAVDDSEEVRPTLIFLSRLASASIVDIRDFITRLRLAATADILEPEGEQS